MTLHILGIDKNPDQARDQFWASAGNILIDLANVQSSIGQAVDDVIAAGGDIERRGAEVLQPGAELHVRVQSR